MLLIGNKIFDTSYCRSSQYAVSSVITRMSSFDDLTQMSNLFTLRDAQSMIAIPIFKVEKSIAILKEQGLFWRIGMSLNSFKTLLKKGSCK